MTRHKTQQKVYLMAVINEVRRMSSTRKSNISDMTFIERDDLTELVIRTHVPDKWRFVDLETGDIWMPDPRDPQTMMTRAKDITIGFSHENED